MKKHKRPASPESGVGETLRELLEEGLAPLLEPLGYELEGSTLRRVCRPRQAPKSTPPVAVFLIQLLKGKDHQDESGSFAFELGVHYPALVASILKLPSYAYLRPHLSPPQLAVCAQRERLGELWKGYDFWWSIGPDTDLKTLTSEIAVVVLEVALPWLQDRLDWRVLLQGELGISGLAAWKLAADQPEADAETKEGFTTRLRDFLAILKDGAQRSQLQAWS